MSSSSSSSSGAFMTSVKCAFCGSIMDTSRESIVKMACNHHFHYACHDIAIGSLKNMGYVCSTCNANIDYHKEIKSVHSDVKPWLHLDSNIFKLQSLSLFDVQDHLSASSIYGKSYEDFVDQTSIFLPIEPGNLTDAQRMIRDGFKIANLSRERVIIKSLEDHVPVSELNKMRVTASELLSMGKTINDLACVYDYNISDIYDLGWTTWQSLIASGLDKTHFDYVSKRDDTMFMDITFLVDKYMVRYHDIIKLFIFRAAGNVDTQRDKDKYFKVGIIDFFKIQFKRDELVKLQLNLPELISMFSYKKSNFNIECFLQMCLGNDVNNVEFLSEIGVTKELVSDLSGVSNEYMAALEWNLTHPFYFHDKTQRIVPTQNRIDHKSILQDDTDDESDESDERSSLTDQSDTEHKPSNNNIQHHDDSEKESDRSDNDSDNNNNRYSSDNGSSSDSSRQRETLREIPAPLRRSNLPPVVELRTPEDTFTEKPPEIVKTSALTSTGRGQEF